MSEIEDLGKKENARTIGLSKTTLDLNFEFIHKLYLVPCEKIVYLPTNLKNLLVNKNNYSYEVANLQLLERLMTEKEFLHKVSNPITVALGMTDSALSGIGRQQTEEELRRRLESTRKAIVEVAELIAARRRKLRASSES